MLFDHFHNTFSLEHVVHDTWHMARDTWHLTRDTLIRLGKIDLVGSVFATDDAFAVALGLVERNAAGGGLGVFFNFGLAFG